MDKNRKSLVFSLLFALAFMLVSLGVTSADAHGRGQGPCGMGGPGQGFGPLGDDGPMPRNFGQYLNLSTKQQQQMQALQFKFMKETLDTREGLGKKRLERKALLESDPVEWKKVDQLTDETAKLEATMEKGKMRHRAEIKKILTPEQLEKFNTMNCPQGQGDGGPAAGPGCTPGRGMGKGPACGMGKGMGL